MNEGHTPGRVSLDSLEQECIDAISIVARSNYAEKEDEALSKVHVAFGQYLRGQRGEQAAAPKLLEACKLLMRQVADGDVQVFEDFDTEDEVSAFEIIEAIVKEVTGQCP